MARNYSFYTPPVLADYAASFAPTHAKRFLEPSVGDGRLLRAVLGLSKNVWSTVCCVDINVDVTRSISRQYANSFPSRLNVVVGDFLDIELEQRYDFVAMNPPYDARRGYVDRRTIVDENGCVPLTIEAAFVAKAASLLSDDGVLAAVVSEHLVSSKANARFRRYLVDAFQIVCIHEFEDYRFESTEAATYLLVLRNVESRPSARFEVRNHSVVNPIRLLVEIDEAIRFDYKYFEGQRVAKQLKSLGFYNWQKLSNVATVKRGLGQASNFCEMKVHTSNRDRFFWLAGKCLSKIDQQPHINRNADENAILMARVGRNIQRTVGILEPGALAAPVTECVLVITPKEKRKKLTIMFALRVLFALPEVRSLVIKGTAAKHVSVSDLNNCPVPINLAKVYRLHYRRWKDSVAKNDLEAAEKIESVVAEMLRG